MAAVGTASRLAIIDDVESHRNRLRWQARLAGFEAVLITGRYRRVTDLVEEVEKAEVDGVLCDFRLTEGNFASFSGASAVAAFYDASLPSILVTDYSNSDVNTGIRLFRRKIPVLMKTEEVGLDTLRRGLEESRREVVDHDIPIGRRPRRALVMIDEVRRVGGGREVIAFVPQWRVNDAVVFPESLVPRRLRRHLRRDEFLLADVNTDAERAEDLYFDDFELPLS